MADSQVVSVMMRMWPDLRALLFCQGMMLWGSAYLQVGFSQTLLKLLIPPLVLCDQCHHGIALFRPANEKA